MTDPNQGPSAPLKRLSSSDPEPYALTASTMTVMSGIVESVSVNTPAVSALAVSCRPGNPCALAAGITELSWTSVPPARVNGFA
jgi:hypothetical protein